MEDSVSVEERIFDLRKKISILEWDIGLIENDILQSKKRRELRRYRNELNQLKTPIRNLKILPEKVLFR